MATLLNEIRGLSSSSTSATIDNHIFRAYHVFTSRLLLAASGILLSSQFFGDPIDCIASGDYSRADAAKKSIDNFCWVSATYTIVELYDRPKGLHILDEGIGQFLPNFHTQRFQLYYRWMPLLLIVQAVLFYIPRYFWQSWESGKMDGLSTMLNIPVEPTLDGDRRRARIELLLDYLESFDTNAHNYYTYRFYFCEWANFALLMFNVWLTNWVSDGLFSNIGPEFVHYGYRSRVLVKLFPNQAQCEWRVGGPSGNIQPFNAICVLPLNAFSKSLFVFLWFWYVMLAACTICWLIFRGTTVFLRIKSNLLRWKACGVNYENHHHPENTDCIDNICKFLPHPDWFVVLMLVDNTDTVAIKSILGGLCERIRHFQRRRRSTNPQIITSDEKPLLNLEQ